MTVLLPLCLSRGARRQSSETAPIYHILEAPRVLTVCVDMPSFSRILEASPQKPLLTIYFYLRPALIRELALELEDSGPPAPCGLGAMAFSAGADFMEAMLRLASITDKGGLGRLRADMALKDLHFLLLTGPGGKSLREIYAHGAKSGQNIFAAIAYMKERLDRVVSAAETAHAAHMSESSLYRHFKAMTGISPLQYHKRLRLHKAREIIMTENKGAAAAGYRAGYESVSQFSREYKKMFGAPPKRSRKGSK